MMDRRLLVLAGGMFAMGTDSFVIAGILGQVAQSFDVSVSIAAQMVTLYALSYALLSPVVAALAASWPRKTLMLAGLGIFIVANVITARASTIGLALASRVLAGLGTAMYNPTATATGALLVPPEQRGRALAIVIGGLSSATALGAPIGTFLGGWLDWRATMWFVAAVGTCAAAGIWYLLPNVTSPLPVSLARRLEPLGDRRVQLTLLTTWLAYSGLFVVYTYVGVAFARATGGDSRVLALLLLLWGVAGTAGNFWAGRLTDRFGSRFIINGAIALVAIDFALMPWSSATVMTAIPALLVWGLCGWGLLVPQQHRLISLSPTAAPLLLGLNSAAVYIGVSLSGVIGAAALLSVDAYSLGLVGTVFIAAALLVAELANKQISAPALAAARPAALEARDSG